MKKSNIETIRPLSEAAGPTWQRERLFQLAHQAVAQVQEVYPEKVASLHDAIQGGFYRVKSRSLAELLIPRVSVTGILPEWWLYGDGPRMVGLLANNPSLAPEYLEMNAGSNRLPEAITVLLNALEIRDYYTGKHSIRVTTIAHSFARHLGIRQDKLESLKIAGYLHDIGKLEVSNHILLMPRTYTSQERAVMETHPLISGIMLAGSGLTREVLDIVLYHHERWDGRGYPYGLVGEEIPLPCRMLSLADTFEALISNRPYRRRRTPGEALKVIRDHAGTQFDPEMTRVFSGWISGLVQSRRTSNYWN